MNEPNLLILSLTAFLAVFAVLGALAALIRALTSVFPVVVEESDSPLLAAIATAASAAYPGTRVTNVEERK
jgi:hypothetical protein